MNGFLKATFNSQKFQGFFINTALGNFAAYVAGSLVTIASTRQTLEQRGFGNLFGLLPRKKIVVHLLPHWLEWLLALIVGFLVMEAVRYWLNHRKYAAFLSGLRPKRRTERGAQGCDQPGDMTGASTAAVPELRGQVDGAPSISKRVDYAGIETKSVTAPQASTRLEQLVQYMRDRAGRPR